jgi:altronate dehydratase
MGNCYDFHAIGRLPAAKDNVAIATKRLEAGSEVYYQGTQFTISHTVLEGHRFAIAPIAEGEPLLSWGLPFGMATTAIQPGEYVCNQKILEALALRNVDFALPSSPNFRDQMTRYLLNEKTFQPGLQVPRYTQERFFLGYKRSGNRGVGTRNYIVIMGTTSRTSGYARTLAERFKGIAARYPHLDGIVAVTHTEGGGTTRPNNLDLLLRTLANYIIHPNIGAILAVDYGTEPVTNQMLRQYMEEQHYPLNQVMHHFWSIQGSFQASLDHGERIIHEWLAAVNAMERTEQSLTHLKIALQCGGSDAFSGISANPLAACVAKEVIRYGGSANLAETDELIGAEHYVLQNVKDLETARQFLDTIERFKGRASWHGHTAEGNPSGGNNFRGLYNIAIKSIGAAMKRHPDVCLDYVIAYGERMQEPGYYFMDSPGNDLESIAGQVASGANMIFFTTGNGSITNFPFVPTIKIVTTTGRYHLLPKDMDVNAGAYLDGTPMEELGKKMLDLTIRVASGEQTVGEKAGHSQVSIWRNWRQTDASNLQRLLAAKLPNGKPIPLKADPPAQHFTFYAIQTKTGYRSEQIGLVLPTSLCSGQIAQLIAERLNQQKVGRKNGISRFVSLAHTEGCGASSGSSEELYTRTLIGHLIHPMVACGLLLEHGCEKTHNDFMANALAQQGIDRRRYGWASVQLDGGIEAVTEKVEAWFRKAVASLGTPQYAEVGLEHLRIGLTATGLVTEKVAQSFALLTKTIVGVGGTVIIPGNATLLISTPYVQAVFGEQMVRETLAYGQNTVTPGLHIMETPTDHMVETLTGLGATGVDVLFAHVVGNPLQSHRMIPLLQGTTDATTQSLYQEDLDLVPADLHWAPEQWATQVLEAILQVASRRYTPKLFSKGNTDFQFTRGLLGISM